MTNYANIRYQPAAASTTTVANMAALIALTGMSNGDQALVQATNKLYMYSGTGWYLIATIQNDAPSAITGVNGTYELAIDGTVTTITAASTDPEGFPLTWSYSTSGLGSIATVSNVDNVFTITPSTTEADAGTFTLTINATDGVNGAVSTSTSLTLNFIFTVTDSNYTTLLATATAPNSTVYRYFKFIPQEMRSATPDAMQYSEFELTDGTSYYSPDSASQLYRADDTDGDDYTASQNVAASIDGSTGTKLFNGGWATKYYLYDMGSSFNTVLTGWRYKTGDDADSRDPVSWTLLGSTNNTDWVILDQRTQETITTSRQTATQDFLFNSSNQIIQNHANSNYPITVNGDAHAGKFSPYRSGGYSTSFDGTGDYLRTPTINLSGNFTIEFFVNLDADAITTDVGIFSFGTLTSTNSILELYNYTNGQFRLYSSSGGDLGNSSAAEANKWYHVAITRSGNTFKAYLDGVEFADDTTARTINSAITIGGYVNTSLLMSGYIRDFRITTNVEYPSNNFTPPSEPLTAITGTVLLTCHLPYFADGSTNDHSITANGSVSTKPFSPYDYNEYSATDHGGSVYFDGSGDYLTLGSGAVTAPSGDFTAEAWAYPTGASSGANGGTVLCFGANNGIGLRIFWDVNWNHFRFLVTGGASTGAYIYDTNIATATPNAWYHVAAVRTSGLFKFYVNGVLQGTGNNSVTFEQSAFNLARIGYNTQNTYIWHGYISDVRYNNSTALYTSNDETANVPTAPLSSTGAELHLKGTDASIIDKSQGANLKLVGNTTGSTTQAKFVGTKSMYFDGTTDYIISQEPVLLGTQDFTAECWVYYQSGLELMGNRNVSDSGGFSVRMTSTSLTVGNSSGTGFGSVFSGTTSSLTNAWHHIAVSRSSGVTKIYVDGSSIASHSSAIDFSLSNPFVIGYAYSNGSGSDSLQGYIQDFRISKGLARYTANFTPPTASLEG